MSSSNNWWPVARTIAARDGQRPDVPDVEWDALQRAGDGAGSLEQATGSVVLAGFLAARRSVPRSGRAAWPARHRRAHASSGPGVELRIDRWMG